MEGLQRLHSDQPNEHGVKGPRMTGHRIPYLVGTEVEEALAQPVDQQGTAYLGRPPVMT